MSEENQDNGTANGGSEVPEIELIIKVNTFVFFFMSPLYTMTILIYSIILGRLIFA